jgi:thiamine biosynthesis lipoprotein
LALRWAAATVRDVGCHSFLIDAGGDCVYGHGPDEGPWRIGVEDPAGGRDPVAVLEVADGGCATSATRVHSWRVGGRSVHHLIDPHTGRPGGGALRSVTVVGTDPADAEVWSKVLFLRRNRIGRVAEKRGLAALWIDSDGRIGMSSAMARFVIWRRP